MPRISRWFARAGLVYLVLGLAANVGAALFPGEMISIASRPARIHFLVVGWVTQLIMAVMIWMFPKYSKDQPYGNERLLWLAFILLNAGLIIRAIAEPIHIPGQELSWGLLLVISAMCQLVAVVLLTLNVWPRVRAR